MTVGYDEPTCPLCLTPQSGEPCSYCACYAVEVDGHGMLADAIPDAEYDAGVRIKWRLHTPMDNMLTVRMIWRPGPIRTWLCTCEAPMPCKHVQLVRKAAGLRLGLLKREAA